MGDTKLSRASVRQLSQLRGPFLWCWLQVEALVSRQKDGCVLEFLISHGCGGVGRTEMFRDKIILGDSASP